MNRRQFLALCGASSYGLADAQPGSGLFQNCVRYLAERMDDANRTVAVFRGLNHPANRFPNRAKIPEGAAMYVLDMDENYSDPGAQGTTCILCKWDTSVPGAFGGWVFNRGVSIGSGIATNGGDFPGLGLDVSGATEITFRARAIDTPVTVEFFCFGVDGEPAKQTLHVSGLSTNWSRFRLALPPDSRMRNVITGFGWVCSGGSRQTFLLDSIEFQTSQYLAEPRFIPSYSLRRPALPPVDAPLSPKEKAVAGAAYDLDRRLTTTAFAYDNALALKVFLVAGEFKRADLIAEAFLLAMANDRALSGVLRNAYTAGELLSVPAPGGARFARLPGYWSVEDKQFYEDHYSVSVNTGNLAWVALALLAHADIRGDSRSFAGARQLADWIIEHCKDDQHPNAGFLPGLEGWENQRAAGATIACATNEYGPWGMCRRKYTSVEHQLDLVPLFRRLYATTNAVKYLEAARHAAAFIERAWREGGGRYFLAGTWEDDSFPPREADGSHFHIPLDVHPWAVLALRGETEKYKRGLEYVEEHHKVDSPFGVRGFGFRASNGTCYGNFIWMEGTSQVGAAYRALGIRAEWQDILRLLAEYQDPSGGIPASSGDGLDTGFDLFSFYQEDPDKKLDRCTEGSPWLYFNRLHVGATAWAALCSAPGDPVNPYWLGAPPDLA